jgi:hypothetical protein
VFRFSPKIEWNKLYVGNLGKCVQNVALNVWVLDFINHAYNSAVGSSRVFYISMFAL